MIRPLENRVVVKPIESESVTKSGIIIPDSAQEKPVKGIVEAIGTDKNLTVKIGDTVLYSKYSGTEIKINEDRFLIMRESEIFAII